MLKAPGTTRLKLKYDDPLSNFAFNFNLRRYNKGPIRNDIRELIEAAGRGSHSSTFHPNLSRSCRH
jgi:hypothetical protein